MNGIRFCLLAALVVSGRVLCGYPRQSTEIENWVLLDIAMAPGSLGRVLPLSPNLPSSPVKVTDSQGVSSTRDLYYRQKVKQVKAGRWLSCSFASPPPPSSLRKCRPVIHEKIQLGRAATRQQQQFEREDTPRRLQSPSRGTERLRNFCKPAGKAISADAVSTVSTGPALDSNLSSQTRLNAYQSEKLKFGIVTVNTSNELLAAATLRAQLFYSYPHFSPSGSEGLEGIKARLKHDFAVQDLLKLRVKSEFERDTKMQDLNMNVKCLLAVCEESNHDELLLSSKDKRNSLLTPPAVDSPAFSRKPLVAIGTLDIQDGTGSTATVDVSTVTFQLFNVANAQKKKLSNRRQVGIGRLDRLQNLVRQVSENGSGHRLLSFSSKQESHVKHGYIFNLCVTETARRHGVATALMKEAVNVAQQVPMQILYVHVEAYNNSALALYQKLGYMVEEEEPPDVEYRFQRPRRILLSYRFQ